MIKYEVCMLFKLFAVLSLAVASASASAQVLLSDNFIVSSDTPAKQDLNRELSTRQKGTLAIQTYTKAGCADWQVQIDTNNAAMRFYPQNNAPCVSLNHNFTETGEFH